MCCAERLQRHTRAEMSLFEELFMRVEMARRRWRGASSCDQSAFWLNDIYELRGGILLLQRDLDDMARNNQALFKFHRARNGRGIHLVMHVIFR